jgi:DNA mismatch repair protein MutS
MNRADRLELDSRGPAPSAQRRGGFESVLFDEGIDVESAQEPPFFADLNLDQVVEAITAGREEYDLTGFFYTPLRSVAAVEFRHEVFRDFEEDEVREAVRGFADAMQKMRRYLNMAKTQRYKYEKERWFLDAAAVYGDAVSSLARALTALELSSVGLRRLREYVTRYTASERFTLLAAETKSVLEGLAQVKYTLRIRGRRVALRAYDDERDYSVEVEHTFDRFRQGQVEDHRFKLPDPGSMDHVEAQIVELVARLYPDAFRALDAFVARHRDFLNRTIARFDREVQFYLAYAEHTDQLAGGGLSFCYPTVSERSKAIGANEAFDIALAGKLANEQSVVRNDFFLRGPERVLVVTGPNQGGKTTFARMFGQLHYLASLGVPVPAKSAQLFLCDRLFTHFAKEEDISTLRGKLEDELIRVHEILEQATGDSVVILNEIFTSTTLDDAIYLGTEVLWQIIELGALAVCVTFVDELASLAAATVSMVATVEPEDPAKRTYKIVRRPADGRAYAWAIAAKYGLSPDALRSRIKQ